jgi:hypothetical protein
MYLYNRGKGAKGRVMHLAMFDRHGNVAGSWCGRSGFNTSINIPLGLRVCKLCRKEAAKDSR